MESIGLISDPKDPHTISIASHLKKQGFDSVFIDSTGLSKFSYKNGGWYYKEDDLKKINVFYFRNMLSPLPPAYFDGEYKLYQDWYTQYMHSREIFGVELSWLYALQAKGKDIVNPPTGAGIGVLKPHQLFVLKENGFLLPKTLITNDPKEAENFINETSKVIYKPAMGGAYTELADTQAKEKLELIKNHYVIFQEFVKGKDIRVTATEDEILAACELESEAIDFRATPGYLENQAKVTSCHIPDGVVKKCLQGIKILGMRYSGIDIKLTGDGKYIFLEFNVHPAFLWLEEKTGVPISSGLARFLVKLNNKKKATTC